MTSRCLLDTGDMVSVSITGEPNLNASFVAPGGSIDTVGIDGVLLPFHSTSGVGQTINMTLSNSTVVPVTYDENLNTITVESTSYSSGDAFYLDGKKLDVFDYYGLTVVSVNVAPILVAPRSINIPVVISEVPAAIGYKVSYVGPNGVEITALSGVTTVQHNITGLMADTAYTVKLYADTGSGYELTAQLTTTTLANVAANYDMSSLTQDGVINLSSLPENTISDINEVIDELLTTGDIVSVSVSDKLTSFINMGDELSIKEINGVLMPFESSSGTGQYVSVVLSDDSTIVPIIYDNTVNSVTVEGVVYYSGDSFILDGKKATVIEY